MFTTYQIETVADIVSIYETGKKEGDYGLVAVLKDGAGISYGRHQTTENSGGLHTLLAKYYDQRVRGEFADELRPFVMRLYGSTNGSKGSMTENELFQAVLRRAGMTDPKMQEAQDLYFTEQFMAPALKLAEEYDVKNAIGLLQLYDMTIHSGPKNARAHVEYFNEAFFEDPFSEVESVEELTEEQKVTFDRAWTEQLVAFRHRWLSDFTSATNGKTEAVRKTIYRTASTMKLLKSGNWSLERPFTFTLVRDVIGLSNKEFRFE